MLLLGVFALATGCDTTGARGSFDYAPRNDDIVSIYNYYPQLPWIRNVDDRITGIKTRTYFQSGRTGKGTFVPGEIAVELSLVVPRREGGFDRVLLHEWRFSERAAAGFRILRESMLGDSYGFALIWPDELELMGHRIEVRFKYRRSDGRVIYGPRRQFKVPLPPGYRAPATPLRELLERARQDAPVDQPPAPEPTLPPEESDQ